MSKEIYIEKNTALVERCKQGDRRAQFEIYKLYSKSMLNVCYRILNHQGEAEDVLQEAFVDAFAKIGMYRQEAAFGAWLKQIVVNKAINQLRSRKIKWIDVDDTIRAIETSEYADYITDLEEGTSDYRVDVIVKGVEHLPEGYRVVLSLYLFEGYDHEEIASILGISESTSRTQYMRGKLKLLSWIKERI